MAHQTGYDCLIKLILLGDTEIGKTALLARFCENCFEENMFITIGVDCKSRALERSGKKLHVQVWDTAGKKRFNTVTPAYFRSAMGAIISYDITCRSSFEHVEHWMQKLDEHGDAAVQRTLVGLKVDLTDLRKISTEEGKQLASRFNMSFFEASPKSGEQVDEVFVHMTDRVFAQRYANISAPVCEKKKSRSCCSIS